MNWMRAMYGGTVFLAAFLLFAVEPMAAKELLPLLGGASAVWVTCLVFFQGALLAGYGFAWWMARGVGAKRVWVYLGLVVAALGVLALPVMLLLLIGFLGMPHRAATLPALSEHPVQTIFLSLGATIGLPFLVLASTSPLVQVWWSRSEGGAVPYKLFALSNAGSLLALVLYPTLIEPRMTLSEQKAWWAAEFVLYAGMCGWLAWRSMGEVQRRANPTQDDEAAMNGAPRSVAVLEADSSAALRNEKANDSWAAGKWLWFLLPMGAAMQLSAVTTHLSQDIAAIPLLWVLPLAVYLVTFILAFDAPGLYHRWIVARMLLVMLAALGYALSKVDTALPVWLAVLFYLVEVFVACWFCHAEAYRLRPEGARESTVFYLMVAAGGVTGTFLIGIASPLVFRANYDLATAFLTVAVLALALTWQEGWQQRMVWATGCLLLIALTVSLHLNFGRHALLRARNFYGALRVTEGNIDSESASQGTGSDGTGSEDSYSSGTGPIRTLMNGRIRHGTQMMEVDRRRMPTTYYGQDSGVGVALRNCCEGRTKTIGVVGLGVGTIAAYGQPGDRMRFYEINPLVEPIARNLFTYLRDSPAAITVVEGDGRASLAGEPAQGFDVLAVDAFSGDAIPLHLLTREAMQVYKRQLAPGGVVAFHVSNSYLDLAPEIARVAEAEGMQARLVESLPVPAEGAYRATWVLVSEDSRFFAKPGVAAATSRIASRPGLRVWTDNYSSLLPVLRVGR
jgi:spermidine synthase